MPDVLRTPKDYPLPVSIAGVGRLPANGVGGILLTVAAEDLRELQDGDGKPLEGKALKDAAQALADARGWELGSISDAKVEKLNELNGAPPERKPLVEVAQESPFAAFASTSKEQPATAVVDPTAEQPAQTASGEPEAQS
jgi:hypothetical protein